MNRLSILLVLLAMAMAASCGLETVASLPAPAADFTQAATDRTQLSFSHDPADYADSSYFFSGYEIYYKVYQGISANDDRLRSDIDTLAVSPTVARLTGMGYSLLSGSSQQVSNGDLNSPYDLAGDPVNPSAAGTITLDFSSFLNSLGANTTKAEPTLEYDGAVQSYVYRNKNLDLAVPSFRSLIDMSAKEGDVASYTAAEGPHYEVQVFVVAQGLKASDFSPLYSKPVAWGILGPIQ